MEVLTARIAWANQPQGAARLDEPGWQQISFEMISLPEFRHGEYSVPHYPKELVGEARGPLALDQTIHFCFALEAAQKKSPTVVTYTAGNRANAVVLLGAYLVLFADMSPQALKQLLPKEVNHRFPCAWAKKGSPQALQPTTTVMDCWDAFHTAKRYGWMPLPSTEDTVLGNLAASQYRTMVMEFDATWLVQGEVMVMADPMSTVRDPNPQTCDVLYIEASGDTKEEEGEEELDRQSIDMASSAGEVPEPAAGTAYPEVVCVDTVSDGFFADIHAQGVPEGSPVAQTDTSRTEVKALASVPLTVHSIETAMSEDGSSVHTVCKVYHPNTDEPVHRHASDFVTYLQRNLVQAVVRTNDSSERGLSEFGGSYSPSDFTRFGIKHFDFFIEDKHGGLPRVSLVTDFLQTAQDLGMDSHSAASRKGPQQQEPGAKAASEAANMRPAIAIHCKGGFGRSMLLACVLVVFLHDVPGRHVLAWARISRPGAFNTSQQEMFLCKLKGRADVELLMKRHSKENACCAVQ